jgi:FkbM family methyltransferase
MMGAVQQQPPFVSNAQNGEDVVLWRALGHVPEGRYVEVGANHPLEDSASRAFYDRGWSGVTVEPVPAYAELHRRDRPRDTLVRAAVTREPGDVVLHVIPDSGLSTLVDGVSAEHERRGLAHEDVTVPGVRLADLVEDAGLADQPVHFLLVDVEGAEGDVLAGVDLTRWRPWVLVVESTAPNSTEQTHGAWEPQVLAAGYRLCLFDGVSRFYVADEHADEIGPRLSYPACVLDHYVTRHTVELEQRRAEAVRGAVHWRTRALVGWAGAVASTKPAPAPVYDPETDRLRAEVIALQRTLSWRVTRPLRGVRRVLTMLRGAR